VIIEFDAFIAHVTNVASPSKFRNLHDRIVMQAAAESPEAGRIALFCRVSRWTRPRRNVINR
jgi:hypothetical protein